MAGEDDIVIDIRSDVSEAEKAKQKLAELESRVAALKAGFDPLDAATSHYNQTLKSLQKEVNQARSGVQEFGTGSGKAGQLLMQAGYAADDLQYGFKGIANNIQPILQSIPGLGAMAGPLSIAAIATYQLYEHWDQVVALMGTGLPQPALTGPELLADNVKKATEQLEELQKKASLAWYEVEKLGKLKLEIADKKKDQESQKTVDAALKQGSDDEKAAGSGFGKALAESGGHMAHDEFLGKLRDSKDAKGQVYNEAKGRNDTPENAARDMMAAALGGDKRVRDSIASQLDPGSRFKSNIDKFSPERAKKDKDYKEFRDSDAQREESELQGLHDRDARRKKEAEPAARGLQGRFNVLSASGHAPDEAGVRRQMERSGMGAEDAQRLAPHALESLKKGYEEELGRRSLAKGLDRQGAATDIVKEQEEKYRKESVEKADKATAGTGFDQRAQDAMLRHALGRGGLDAGARDATKADMKRELIRGGMSESDAEAAAKEKADKLFAKLGDDVNGHAAKAKEAEMKGPQHLGVGDFAQSVESAASADMKKMVALQEDLKAQLVELVRLTGRGPRLPA